MRAALLAMIFAVAAVWGIPAAQAADLALTTGAGSQFSVPIVSLKEARFKTVVKQKYDFSCGSAALATLLTFHYNRPTSEEDVFRAMYENGDKEKIKTVGFSLLDMKNELERLGYKSDGFKTDLERLVGLGVPAIVLIDNRGYKHFVVVKGVGPDRVVIGDPAAGVRVVSRDKFIELWNGVIFVVRSKASVGRDNFNLKDDWSVQAKAPFGTALSRQSLASFSVHLHLGTNTF